MYYVLTEIRGFPGTMSNLNICNFSFPVHNLTYHRRLSPESIEHQPIFDGKLFNLLI